MRHGNRRRWAKCETCGAPRDARCRDEHDRPAPRCEGRRWSTEARVKSEPPEPVESPEPVEPEPVESPRRVRTAPAYRVPLYRELDRKLLLQMLGEPDEFNDLK